MLFLCFCCVFCSLFAVVCVVCTPLPAFGAVSRCVVPPVLLCASHLHRACGCTWGFSVPPGAVFWCSCVFFVAFAVASALWFSSPLVFAGCWCVVLVSLCVGCAVASCVVGGWLVCVSCVLCCSSSVGSVLFWVVRFFAPGGVVVAGVFPLLCVAPSWCWFMRFLLSWWFLVVVGPPPLFLIRHDLGWLWSCSWFNAECHPGWVAVWCFCSWRSMGVRLGVLSCSSRCLRTRRFCLVCVLFGFLLPGVFRLVLVSLVLLFLSAPLRLCLGFVSCLARFFWFVLFLSLRLVVCRV